MSKKQKLEDIRKLMLSLLLARKGATLLSVLERDYYEAESRRIPYHHFGFTDLVGFLQSMPEHFIVEQYNGTHYVRGIASEKSKHVGLLVARQKTQPKPKYIPPHLRQPLFNRRAQHMKSQQVKIAPDKLFSLMCYIKNNPHGVSLQNAVAIIQQIVPFINITTQELRAQLYELSHQLYLDGNMIYPVWNNDARNVAQQPLMEESQRDELQSDSRSLPAAQIECAAGQEDFVVQYFSDDDDDFVPAAHIDNQRHAETSEQFATSHNTRIAQYANYERTEMFDKARNNGTEIDEVMATNSNMEINAEIHDLSQIVNDRTKLRLEELMRKHPEGIWCADLPNVYFHEYKVRLNYTQLGFASVREFTSYLPKIFYMKQINKTDDFMLYSADKRPVVPKSDPIDITQTSHNRYGKHSTAQCSKDDDDDAPIPSDVSPTITKSFAPNDVMNYNDNVEKISVTELQKSNEYLAVYIVEVFHPNFFWIHLRENKRRFYKMMDELSDFYEYNKNTYTIAKIALKKDMNCACLYMGRWHRGIIKSVKPDFRVTVFFYDYGTLKTYAPEDIYYLHKKFSFLPAQAIPCGLYNVIPSVGDRWKKSVIDQFIDKTADTLLAATIISINPMYNSMMVILTDTSEEEDVVINKWLVNERLAQVGKTVRMFDIIHNLRFNTIESSTRIESSIKTFHAESAVNVNIPRYRNQSISHERMHRLSDVKSEDIENKTVKSLHNVPTSKKATIQMLRMLRSKSPDAKSSHFKSPSAKSLNTKCANAESVDTKTLDTKSQSRKYVRDRDSKMSRKLVSLEKLKTLNQFDSNPNTSTSEANTDNEDNARPIDSNRNLQNNNDDYNCYGYMNFSLRNSDDENDTEDFGTFRSLYGGHGFMEPFDWSVIREENNRPHGTIATVSNNLDMLIGKHESDVEDKSGSYKKNEIPGKQYFLNMTRMETEKFLSKNNIDYDIENMSDFIETLRDKTTSHHIIKVMFAPNNKFKTLDNIQSEDTSNANIVNDISSSGEVDQEVDKNDKVCETRVDQKIENRDSNTVSESVFSNISNNKNNINKEISECKTNNFLKSNTNNKVYCPMYKMLLDKMKQMQLDLNSNFMNSSESSSSEQILSSSYSCNTSDDTITSSNDGQSNCMDTSNCIKIQGLDRKLRSMSVELSKNQTLNEPHSDSKETDLSSTETDSIASNVDDIKQHRLNQSLKIDSLMSSNVNDTKQHQLNQSFDSDSIISSYSDDSKCQLNGADQTALNVPKLMQQMLKIVRNIGGNTELDSDDLSSSQESIRDDESDGDNKSDCVSETFQSMSDYAKVIEIASAPPVYNDCDIESDESEWDAYAGSEDFPFYIAQPPK